MRNTCSCARAECPVATSDALNNVPFFTFVVTHRDRLRWRCDSDDTHDVLYGQDSEPFTHLVPGGGPVGTVEVGSYPYTPLAVSQNGANLYKKLPNTGHTTTTNNRPSLFYQIMVYDVLWKVTQLNWCSCNRFPVTVIL